DQGDLTGAVEDLRLALNNSPPAEVVPKTKAKLYETLTEVLQRDFAGGEKYLGEYEKLCRVDVPADADDQERARAKEEEGRRRANYLGLVANGREKQGRLGEAYEAFLQFGALSANKERVNVIDQPTVLAAPAVWSQGRIAAMVAKATPEQR